MIKEFRKTRSRNNTGRYCILICDNCEKEYEKKYSEIKKCKLHFCCKDCFRNNLRERVRGGTSSLRGKRRGMDNPNWRGGRRLTSDGYIIIYKPEHPHAIASYIQEHRLIMEKKLGRYLKPEERKVVHHINGIKDDNRIENLQIMLWGEHNILHHKKTENI